MINSIYIDVEELVLELDRAAESPKVAQDWAARFRDTLIYGGRKKNPLPFGMYCITLSKGFAANGKLGRWKSIAKGILNKRDNNENPTEEEIVAEIIAQNGREEYERVLADIRAAKNAKNLSADAPTSDDGENKATTSADTKPAEPAKNTYGEFGNVKMTTAEFEKLVQAEGADRANALIEELSSYLASSGKRYKSHYATLLNWGRRKDKEETPKQKFLTTEEISQRNIEESKRQMEAILAHRRIAHG